MIPSFRLPAMLMSFALVALVCDMRVSAQESAAPPAPPTLGAEQVAQLIAPIALYPDTLLGQVLTASTYPLEVVKAARWAKDNPNVKGEALESAMQQQPWDPSVKALTAVPQVLTMMSDQLDWTQSLGDAYLAQPDDIAAAVQQLRARADGAGNLKSSKEVQVRRVPAPAVVGAPPEPDYYIIEPVTPDVVYVPIYDPYLVYGVWPYAAYRPFYWYPPGYVAVGVLAYGAPIVVGAALWATYDWRARRVAVDVHRFNRFNRTAIAGATWQHNPRHRGNLPYSHAALQQRFGKPAAGVQGLPKTGIGSHGLPKTGGVTSPQSLPKGAITRTGRDGINVNRSVHPGNTKPLVSPNHLVNPSRNVHPGNTKPLGSPNHLVNPGLNKGAAVNRHVNVNQNVGGQMNVNRNPGGHANINRIMAVPRGNVGPQGAARGVAKGPRPKAEAR